MENEVKSECIKVFQQMMQDFKRNMPYASTTSAISTDCEKTKSLVDAIAIRMKDHLNNNEECDVSKGEIRLPKSSGKVSSLAACRKSCEDTSACQSITLFADGQCQHFSTKCENRKSRDGAIAMRLKLRKVLTWAFYEHLRKPAWKNIWLSMGSSFRGAPIAKC